MLKIGRTGREKCVNIDLKLNDIDQLFNSFDPAPFIEKDLDSDAVDFIVSYFGEYDIRTKAKIVIHLPESQKKKLSEEKIRLSISNFFRYMTNLEEMKIRNKLKEGRNGFMVGLSILMVSLVTKGFAYGDGFISSIIIEGLTIGGWVAMWKPISNILYDWWPMRRQKMLYNKISGTGIEFFYY